MVHQYPGVELDAQLDVIVTPEANVGIKIGGGSLVSATIMDAQLTGYVMGNLSFQASGLRPGGHQDGNFPVQLWCLRLLQHR